MAGYSLSVSQESCYEGTTVLVNKLDIREQKLLDKAEAAIVTARIMDAENNVEFKNVDFEFYKLLHKNIFGDLYSWTQ